MSTQVSIGDRAIEWGPWRIAEMDDDHLSIGHSGPPCCGAAAPKYTAMIYRSDGTQHPGGRTDWSPWDRPLGAPSEVFFGHNMVGAPCESRTRARARASSPGMRVSAWRRAAVGTTRWCAEIVLRGCAGHVRRSRLGAGGLGRWTTIT